MTNKRVTLTLEKLDITQLAKIRSFYHAGNMSRSNFKGAYMYELAEFLDAVIAAGYAGKNSIKSPDLTI